MVDEVKGKFNTQKVRLLNLHLMERESMYMMQVTEWLLRAQTIDREYIGKSIHFVSEINVPKLENITQESFQL